MTADGNEAACSSARRAGCLRFGVRDGTTAATPRSASRARCGSPGGSRRSPGPRASAARVGNDVGQPRHRLLRRFPSPDPAGRSPFRRAAAGFSAAIKAIGALRSSRASRGHSTGRVTVPRSRREEFSRRADALRQPGRQAVRDQPREVGAEGATRGSEAELLGEDLAVDRGRVSSGQHRQHAPGPAGADGLAPSADELLTARRGAYFAGGGSTGLVHEPGATDAGAEIAAGAQARDVGRPGAALGGEPGERRPLAHRRRPTARHQHAEDAQLGALTPSSPSSRPTGPSHAGQGWRSRAPVRPLRAVRGWAK